MTLEQIRKALRDRNLKAVADETGLHYNTVRELRNNPIYNPNYDTYKKMVDYLRGKK